MQPELVLNTSTALSGWLLFEAHLDPRYGHCFSSLRVRRRSRPDEVEEIPLSIMPDGHLVEILHLPGDVDELNWRPPDHGQFDPSQLKVRRIGLVERRVRMAIRVVRTWLRLSPEQRREGGLSPWRAIVDLPETYRMATAFRYRYPLLNQRENDTLRVRYPLLDYPDWVARFDTLDEQDLTAIRAHIAGLPARPRFHVLVSGHGEESTAIAATMASLRAQLYDTFEYTVIDPASGAAQHADESSGHPSSFILHPSGSAPLPSLLSPPSNSDWLMLLRAGDTLPPHALYWFVCEALARPEATVIYADDDSLDESGRRTTPRFKPDWSPEHLRSTHYIGSAAVLRADAVAKAGGVNADDCRHGNYDLLLRVVDTAGDKVAHVPAVLLHRRAPSPESPVTGHGSRVTGHESRATTVAWENPQWCADALRAHLARNGVAAEVAITPSGLRRVRYRLPDALPMISIIVPTRDAVGLLRQCVDSVLAKTTYPRYEILVVDNQSSDPETLAYLGTIAADPRVRVLRYDQPFNFSRINNFAAHEASGEVLCLLNNDTEVISPDWLEEMAGHLLQPRAGAVGAKLFYPDGRVQHVGAAVGPGGCANHLHMGIARDAPGYCDRAVVAQEFSAVTAACLLTWKRLYLELGGLNETELPVAFNDVDYCLRLQEAGHRAVLTPHAELYHHESATRGGEDTLRKRLRHNRELKYMRDTWRERMRHDPYYNLNLSYWRPDFSLTETLRVKRPWL